MISPQQEKRARHRLSPAILAMLAVIAVLCAACLRLWIRAESAARPTSPVPPTEEVPPVSPTPGPQAEAAPPTAEHPTYEDLYPELYAQPAELASVNEEKTVFLTFDDGPSARTPEILAILKEYGVHATFFTVGQTDEASMGYMKQIAEEGHALGIHSFTHDYRKIYAGVEEYLADLKAQYDLIYEAAGICPRILRFPGGSINGYNGHIYQELIAEVTRRGFVYFDWNLSGADAEPNATPASVLAGATRQIGGLRRAFVLLHDSASKSDTVAALPHIIQAYQAEGYTFRALSSQVVPLIFPYGDNGLEEPT